MLCSVDTPDSSPVDTSPDFSSGRQKKLMGTVGVDDAEILAGGFAFAGFALEDR